MSNIISSEVFFIQTLLVIGNCNCLLGNRMQFFYHYVVKYWEQDMRNIAFSLTNLNRSS